MKSSSVRRGKTRNAMRLRGMTSAGLDRGFVALGQRLVAFGVRAHPALGRRAGERPADLGGRAEGEHAFRNLRLGCDEGAGGDHGAGSDPRAVEDGRAVADQAFLAERRRVDRAIVADGRARADLHAAAGVTWTTAQSCTLAPRRTTIGLKSPRSTALYQTDARSSTVTSPMRT